VIVQIYGITTVDDAATVNALRPDNVGVVLHDDVDTWDSVDEPTMRRIVAELRDVRVVALSLSRDPDRVRRIAAKVEPAIVHVARAVDGLGVDHIAQLRADLAPIELMVTIPVRDKSSVLDALLFAPVADYLLLDSMDPASGVVGATGLTHDWSWSREIVEQVDVPVILAGGLGPDNVRAAIDAVGPAGVDSETNTSRTDNRRRKDLDKVARFIATSRSPRPPNSG
jgi:phosphoribosylanthranilate isomerase